MAYPSRSAVFRSWSFEAPVVSLCVNSNGDWIAVALGDGTLKILQAHDAADEPKDLKLHDGIALSLKADADAHGFLSGGDDGKVMLIDPVRGETTLLAEHKNQWVDHVAASSDGKYRAYNVGKTVHILDEEGKEKFAAPIVLPSSPGEMSFSPNGKRLAISHYNGLSLIWMNSKDPSPTVLTWKGSHLDVIWTPDGKCVLTSMQENSLHGWQISDGKEMRMQGYASKIRSLSFTPRGKFLATSGADQIICWPFSGGGPWGKPPVTLGGSDARLVTSVASHPKDEMVAAGYSDGMVVLAPLDGRMEIMIDPPSSESKATVNGLVWNAAGDTLFASTESGKLMMYTLESVRKNLIHAQ